MRGEREPRPTSHLQGHSGETWPKGPAGKHAAPPADESVWKHHHGLVPGRHTRLRGPGCDKRDPQSVPTQAVPVPGCRDPTSGGPGGLEAVAVVRADPGPPGADGARMVPDKFPQTSNGLALTILPVLRKGPPTPRLRNYRELAHVPRPSAVRAQALQLFRGGRAPSVIRRVECRLREQKRWTRGLCICWGLDANPLVGVRRLEFRALF